MVSTRLAFIAVGSVVAATIAVQEANANFVRGRDAQGKGNFLEVGDGLEAPELTSIGCFRDAGARAMTGPHFNGAVTPETCNSFCEKAGFPYFGLQYYSYCFCGNADYDSLGAISENECQYPCRAQPGDKCGGSWANLVYKVGGETTAVAEEEPVAEPPVEPEPVAEPPVEPEPVAEPPVEEPVATSPVGPVIEAPKSEFKSLGCYKDTSTRAMAGSTFSGDVTPKTCSNFCKVLGFSYFGLQDHHYCYCGGADFAMHGTLTADKCNTPCTSFAGVMCGGKWANSVYKVGGVGNAVALGKPKLEALGCYKDAADRALGGNTFSGDVTPEICSDYCGVLGFSYFGLQHYDHCFCGGADYAKLGSLPEDKCDTPCNSLPSAMCGGTWANSVFKVREPLEQPVAELK